MNSQAPDSGSLSSPDRDRERPARRLCIVARNHPLLFGYLTTLFQDRPPDAEQIDLVIDRRHDAAPKAPEVERRRSSTEDDLRRRGFAFVAEPGKASSPRDAARTEHIVEVLAGVEEHSWPFRRRRHRRPMWVRIWGQRAWRAVAILGAAALISVLLAVEFKMNERFGSRIVAPKSSRPAQDQVVTPGPPVPAATESSRAESVPADALASTTPSSERAASPTPPTAPADRQRAPDPVLGAPLPQMGSEAPPRVFAGAMEARRAGVPRPSLPDRAPRPAVKPARVDAPAQEAQEAPAPAVAAPSDLRIELSRKPTSATGGGVVFLVRVSDLAGEPLSDAEVSMLAGRRPGGALFETRLYPTDRPGTYQSGVIHPSTLPPDLTVRAVAGNRRVEAPVER